MRSASKSLRYWLEYLGFACVGTLFWLMPVEWASALSGWIWRKIAPNLHRHQRALDNLARAYPELTPIERQNLALDMWENLGRTFAEAFHLSRICASDRVEIMQPELFNTVARSGKGSVFCAAHMGNWEVQAIALARYDMSASGAYQRVRNPLIDDQIRHARAFLYTGGLIPKDRNTVRHLSRHAKGGNPVVVMSDLRDWNGVRVPFFGQPAPSTPFPATLARLLDVPLFVATIVRLPHVRFQMTLQLIEVQRSDNREADTLATTAAIHACLEQAIRANPAQWMWGHRRWG